MNSDDVVAVELDGGFTLWMSGSDLRNELGAEARDGELTLRPSLGDGDSERGVGGWLLKGLKIFGFDPVEGLVLAAAKAVEPKGGDALLHLDSAAALPADAGAWQPVTGELPEADDEPLLLFIHGTFSSTLGSFGELFKAPGPAATLQAQLSGAHLRLRASHPHREPSRERARVGEMAPRERKTPSGQPLPRRFGRGPLMSDASG